MLKRKILRFKNKRQLKKNTAQKQDLTTFSSSADTAIIFTSRQLKHLDRITELRNRLKQDGAKVTLLCYVFKNEHISTLLYDFFEPSDFSFWGNIESGQVADFVNTSYEFLFYLDNYHDEFIDYILTHNSSRCKVGINSEKNEYFQVVIRNKELDFASCLDDMYKYKNMIHNYGS